MKKQKQNNNEKGKVKMQPNLHSKKKGKNQSGIKIEQKQPVPYFCSTRIQILEVNRINYRTQNIAHL
jgi:hypothetical protein